MSMQTTHLARGISETHRALHESEERVRIFLPAQSACVFESKNTIGRAILPKLAQFFCLSRTTLMARIIVFNLMLLSGSVSYLCSLVNPNSSLGYGGLLLLPAAISGFFFIIPSLLYLCLRQFNCNFMMGNLIGFYCCVFLMYESNPVRIGFIGTLASGFVYCYQDATAPAFRGRPTAIASGIAVVQLTAFALLILLGRARPSHDYFYIGKQKFDLGFRAVGFCSNLIVYQFRLMLFQWRSASHRLVNVRCPTRSVLVRKHDLKELHRIVKNLSSLEQYHGSSLESVRALYPISTPRLLLHGDCVLTKLLSLRHFKLLYAHMSLFSTRIIATISLATGLALSTLHLTVWENSDYLGWVGAGMNIWGGVGCILVMNERLLRAMFARFEVVFVLGNVVLLLCWGGFVFQKASLQVSWSSIFCSSVILYLGDAFPARMSMSWTRTVSSFLMLICMLCLLFMIMFGNLKHVRKDPIYMLGKPIAPMEVGIGGLLNMVIFSFKNCLLCLISPRSLVVLRPQMSTARIPKTFLAAYDELVAFSGHEKENSLSFQWASMRNSSTHTSVVLDDNDGEREDSSLDIKFMESVRCEQSDTQCKEDTKTQQNSAPTLLTRIGSHHQSSLVGCLKKDSSDTEAVEY